MPRQKTVKEVQEVEEPISESYISIGLGLLVVVVVGILLYNYFSQKNKKPELAQQEAEKIAQEATMSAKPGSTYTVTEGDTLWSISEKSYNTGYNWEDIAKANNLTNADLLEAGQQLTIPEVSPILPEIAVASPVDQSSPEPQVNAQPEVSSETQTAPTPSITGDSYTIVTGDNLWDIACKAYGDCYAWTKIAEANKLENPDLIFAGNVLSLPR